MAEESSSGGSSGSPGPGDTLPWNLGKHQRTRRAKAAAGNGTVLDPAERAVIRIADERDRVQKKTFTKWVNKHLIKAQRHVNDLYEDLRDGHNLISLLEVLSGDTLPREKGRMRFHKLQNVQIALNYLKHRQVKLVNIRNDDIADGNPKLTLGLIWTIILHFQISDIQVSGQSEDMTAKEKLLLWSQRMVEDYQGLRCDNFSSSWRDGRLFNAIIHRHKPMLIDMNRVFRQSNLENLDQAFTIAERELGVTRLLDPEDVDVPQPDEKSIITYVSSLYDAMPRVPEVQDGVKANELQLRWQEYYEVVTALLRWQRQHTVQFEERRFPASYEEVEILWRQFLKFKETELPAKEADKNRAKAIFQSLEGAVQSGQLKVPPGYHPLDVEKEWGQLHVAVLEREKLLRAEFERLERLQRVVTKLQMESGLCEEQLNQADALLQADVRLLAAGKAAQRAAELERDLDKADGMIRLLFNDVQTLKDGRHPQGEQMYRRVYRLHERLVAIRTEYNLRLKSGAVPAAVPVVSTVTTTAAVPQRPRAELEEATLRYLQDLLAWVEDNQRRLAAAEWGMDLPTVEAQLGSHRGLHQSIEEFRAKIDRARADEAQLSPGSRGAYRECLGKLELQYGKLLTSSKSRLRHLESLQSFVSAATKELLWLSEREEEEVTFDWSHHNPNMAAKKDSYSALMRELEQRERRVQELQSTGEKLLREEHPGRQTLEAFLAALQTQWSWMLQLCCCIERHLKENGAYFQFFTEVQETQELLRRTEETMRRKFSCDRGVTVTRLEDLLQDCTEQKEQLAELGVQLGALARRAQGIIQLKPRSPDTPLQGRPPLQAVCDYKQMEITVHKGDACALLSQAQGHRWRVQGAGGSEALVPSVCFLLPPPNPEALEAVRRLEASHQQLLELWQQQHLDLRCLLAWQCLRRHIQQIQAWTPHTFRSLPTEECQRVLRELDAHYQEFLQLSQDAGGFQPGECQQLQRDYASCTQKYQQLLRSQEKGEQEEALCRSHISQLRDIRLQLESCESRTVTKVRLPLGKEPARECAQRQSEQQQIHLELEGIKKSLAKVSERTEQVLAQPEQVGSAPLLRSELELTLQKMEQVYSLSSIYLEKLKTIDLVIRSTQGAEEMLRKYEEQLKDVQTVPADLQELEASKAELKRLRAQAEGHQPFFSALETDLGKATEVNERLVRGHSERDVDLERYRERAQQLLERWHAVLAQTELRQRELGQLGRQLGYYRESCDALLQWIRDARQRQEQIQAVPITDSKAVREQLLQQKALLEECERNKEKVEECQRYAKQYIDAIKDYELQLVSFKAQVEPVASPAKKPKVQSASDSIIQEYVELRTRYSELTTLSSQYIKFITETLRRLEQEEKAAKKLKEEERQRLAEVEAQLEKQRQLAEAHAKAKAQAEAEAEELQLRMQEEVTRRQMVAVDAEQQKQNIQQELLQLRQNSDHQIKSKVKLIEEAEYNRKKVEEEIRLIRLQLENTEKQRAGAETELQELRARAEEAERQKRQAQEEAERLRRQVKEESQKKREAEEELQRKVQAERDAAREKQKAVADLEKLRLQAEEAERRMRQAEAEKERQIQVAQEVAQRSAEATLQSKRLSFAEKTAQLELSLQQEHNTVAQLQEEAERLKKQQLEAEQSREEAEKELEHWRQKANEALRLRLQAEEVAHKKTLAQQEAEKQKEDAEREARKRAKAEESALRQKELAEEELEKQRELAEGTAQQRLAAEQELIRLKAEMENGEQQRLLLEEELSRLKTEVSEAIQKRKEVEDELAKLRAEMEVLLESKAKTEEESRSSSEKSKQRLEAEASKLRELAEEAARLRALSEEAKRQRQLAEEEAGRQRAEAERILKEKLAAINEASRLKAEAEIALKEKEAENERLRRLAEDEAYQRKLLEEQAAQHKQDIEEKIAQLKRSSESELERQKAMVEDTLRQRRQVEEEIRALKASFEKASAGKTELERELGRIRGEAEEVQRSREQAEREAERQRALALEEEGRRREAEEKVQAILAAEEEAGRQRRLALEEVERLKAMVEEARRQKELAEKESERQIQLAREAAQKRIEAEEKAHMAAVQQKEQELLQTRQQEQSLLERLREEAERARRVAEEAEFARSKAEQDAGLSRQRVEEAERLKQRAEEEAQAKAQAQEDAEKLRKEAELEAAKRAQAEQAALRQKQLADAEMEKHKKFAEQTLRQKAQVEQELTKVKLQLDETDHQKGILDEELQRLKEEVTDAVRQKAQVEEELFKVRVQMEELAKLKSRIEEENKALILRDKDNTQKFLAEEAEKMKQVAEEVARLSVEAQEAARMRQLAEDDLAQQRALAEKMLKEKMQAVQEATRLKAEAEMLQKQKDLAQEHAKRLQEDKEQMQQRLAEETEGFQKTLEAERRRQLEITAEAERLKLHVAEMSMAQAKAEEEAKKFKKQAEEISQRLHQTELSTQEKMTLVQTLEMQRHQSDQDAEKLRQAITELEQEKEKLKQEAALLQQKAEEMQVAQQAQLRQETQLLQQSFLTEKDALLQKEKFIEEEKAKLEKLFKDEVDKAQNLKAEQERQQKEMEQEKQQLKAMLDEAKKHQQEAEENVRHKQEELQQLERQRQEQEKLLEEENKRLRERLEQMQEEYKAALAQTREIMIQTDELPGVAVVTATQQPGITAVPNGRDALDGLAQNGEPEFAFDGIRQKVSAEKLAAAGILSEESLEKLAKGKVSVEELSQREDIKKYLQGKSSIAGLLIKPSNQKMSIYEAMKKKLLSPGTALVLLEAQAASGFIIDPVRNARLSVNEAVREGVIGPELHNKMLAAERAVTGYKDPYTGDKISLFQAMQKELIVKEHGIRLLEAQIATGGIIDPVHSHRLPVEAAYQRGYFDQEMNRVLSDPGDDTKGFFDPNTQENLTYLQLLERCVTDPETGLCLLPLTDQAASARELLYTDKEAKDVFKKATVTAPFGKFQGKTMTIWEIINSEYFTEDQRRDLIQQYRTGKITVEKIIKIIITVVEESEKKSQMCFEGLRAPVPAAELLESKVITRDLYNQLHQGKKSVKDVAEMKSVQQYLKGTDAIAGILVESTGQKLTFYEALKRNLLKPEVALSLLEAQAATGYLIDPVRNKFFSVDEAVKAEVVGPEFHEKLLSAERAVTGYKDPYTGQTVSLFQALQKGLIPSDTGLRLLDVQLATGGIIDPVHSHRLPLEVAYKRGYFDPEVNAALGELRQEAKAFYCPNRRQHLSYGQLQESCHRDQQTGLCLLPLSDDAIRAQQEEVYTDSQAKECFDKATVEVPVGSMKGQTMTIWDLIHSEYFTEEHRRELLRQYKTGKVTIEKIIKIVITIIEEAETKKQEKLTFSGLRAPVPASELLESHVISKAQYEQLKEGKKSVKDLAETDAIRRFLHGSDCIAGVYVEATKEKLNIYEAMKRNLLRPSTAVILLEAQAATGFLIDPVKNRKLYVNEAVKAGVVGPELHEKLLSAEKAVTGYKDPYSGDTISLFQAMKKGLIVKEHGIRLLEAQVATGGIIDPVHSHRLPVEVAYQRGYFDQEMNQTLSDPSDDTKGFFDPNTQENLTYTQLKERCIEDPETGLYLLPLREPEKPKVVETTHMYTEAETRKVFEETQVDIPVGSRAGSSMSLWEIMHSDLLPEEQRKHLMEEFQSGRVSKERMIIIIIEIIEKTEIIRQQNLTSYDYVRRRITAEDLYESKIISQDIYNLLKQGSKTFRELLDTETVWKYLYGSGCVAGIYIPSSKQKLSIYQALKKGLISSEVARSLLEAQAATGFMIDPVKNEMLTVDEAVRKGVVGPEIHDRLLSAERAVTGYRDPYSEQKISVFQAMKKDLIPSEEALKLLDAQLATGGIIDPHLGFHLPLEVAYQRGFINKETHDMLSEPSEVRSYVDPSTDEKLSYTQLLRRCRPDEGSRLLLLPLSDTRRLTFRGLRKQITMEELVLSQVMDEATAQRLQEGLTSIEEVSKNLKKFLEGTSCIAGVFVDSTKERLSIYQAMKKGIIRPGTAFELLEAQAATGYVIDPIKGLKLTVEEAVRMGIVGPEFKDKLLSAERAVTGYRDPYSGKLISLFQAMKKGLILKDHGIRLLEAQIATGGIIDPEESHRLPVEVAYKRGLFDEEMNEILLDPSDDTKGFFDPNTEENLTYLQLMERCVTDPETGLCLLPLKEKKRERKTSSKSSVRKRRVVIVDPETGKEMSVYEAYRKGLIDHQTYLELSEQECEWEEITTSSSDGVVKSMIIDRRSGRQYDIDDAISKGLIDQSALDQYRSGTLSITEFADMLSGNMGGFRSRSSSVGSSSSSYSASPAPLRTPISVWSDPTEETGPVAGILDTDTLEKVSITEAMRRNLVDNITGQRLLEAQACTGGIIDPNTGDRCSVADALAKGLVDKIMVDRINLAQKAFYGFEDPRTKTKMSAAQALKKGWLYYEAGQRFLEVQYLTGGLIEPDAPGRVSLDEALQKGTIDARTAQKLRDVNTYSKYLTCPKTKLKISYKDAMERSMIEDGTGLRLLEASSQSSKGYYSPYNLSSAGSAAGSRTGSRTGSRSGSRRGSFDATGSGFSMTFSSSSYSSSTFGRRYAAGPQSTAELAAELALALSSLPLLSCGQGVRRGHLGLCGCLLPVAHSPARQRGYQERSAVCRNHPDAARNPPAPHPAPGGDGGGDNGGDAPAPQPLPHSPCPPAPAPRRTTANTMEEQEATTNSLLLGTGHQRHLLALSSMLRRGPYHRPRWHISAAGPVPPPPVAVLAAACLSICLFVHLGSAQHQAPSSHTDLVPGIDRSWLCPRGATAAAGHSLAQAPSAAKDASVTRKSMEGSELDGEEMERTQQPGKCPERCSEVQEQLLALRHWLDAMEKQLPAQTEPGTVPQLWLGELELGWGVQGTPRSRGAAEGRGGRYGCRRDQQVPVPKGSAGVGTREISRGPVRGRSAGAGRDPRWGHGTGSLAGTVARAMGNSVSRPSCLGERSRRHEELLREPDAGQPLGSAVEAWPALPEKLPVENGWSPAAGARQSGAGSPVLRRSRSEVSVQNGSAAGVPVPVPGQVGGATWTPPRSGAPRGAWPWQPLTTREVTEVTEVTETIVTEIVEVTQYPMGERGGEALLTRTVTVTTGHLTGGRAGHSGTNEVSMQVVAVPEEVMGTEQGQDSVEQLLAWVADMEELVGNQKSPSAEAKVAKAQLEEQKLLKRLLEERRPRVELLLQDRAVPAAHGPGTVVPEGSSSLSGLQEKWQKLMEEAEARYSHLERILPVAQAFQEAVDSFQEWLASTERQLAQLWRANGCLSRLQDAHQQTQVLCEEIRGRLGELDGALASGQQVLEMVTGEEAQLAQEKMEALRMRYLIAGQSSADTEQRLRQALEASSRLGTAPEELALWLGQMETELDTWDNGHEAPVSDSDREKFQQVLEAQLCHSAALGQRLEDISRVQLDASALCTQLADQKLLSAEVLQHRALVERLLGVSELLLLACPEPLRQHLQPSVRALRESTEQLCQRSAASALQLEQAQHLLAQFSEALDELWPWLEETQDVGTQLAPSASGYEAFREQQALLQCLREAIAEHRPVMGKLQRVVAQLAELSPEQVAPFQQRCQEAEEQYGHLRGRVGQAAAVLDDALPRYSQLTERMDLLLESLERLQSRLQCQPGAHGDAAYLREQLRENSLALGELEKLGVALDTIQAQGSELLATMQAANAEAAATGIQERAAQLRAQWGCLQGRCQEQELRLRELLALAERFWHSLAELALTLSDTQQLVLGLEEAGSEPEAIRAQLRSMQALREEIEALQGELDTLGTLGVELMASCGDPDKPDVTKSLDELYSSWHSLNKAWTERFARLEEQLQAAVTYQDTMQRLLEWLEAGELRVADEFLVGGDLDVVQQQLAELKEFKRELYQCKVDVESLRHQAGTAGTGQGDAPSPLGDFRRRWDRLEEEVVSRQHQLEAALLGLGQFQHQLEELLRWLGHTGEQLRGPTLLSLDLQSCEIELAKHRVLRNDVLCHARTVQAVSEAGQGLLLGSLGDGEEGLRKGLQQLRQRWDLVLSQTESRQLELENNLSQVQDITLEMTELLQWLEQVELQLFFSKPVWGHPDTTKETLTAHLELCRVLESKQDWYGEVRARLRRLLASGCPTRSCGTQHRLRLLETKWDSVQEQARLRKEQLAEGLTVTTEFHGTAQELLRWVAHTEELLGSPAPPSFVLDTVTEQIQEHKALLKEASAHGEQLAGLEAVAARLRDFSRRQDGAVIQNLLLSARERLGKVLQRAAERGEQLEDARKRAKQFSESRRLLLDWMDEVEQSLEVPQDTGLSQEEIKDQLAEHKAFQKVLRAKRPVLEATLRSGRALRERARCQQDLQPLEELLGELKERWDGLCARAAERQHQLEEQLLFSGRFSEALRALLDWLCHAEPQLCQDAPVGGHRDLVADLMDKHKVFQKELGKRASCVRALKRWLRDLPRGSAGTGDSQWLQQQVEELSARWDLVCALSVCKQTRLEAALRQAEEFHSLVQSFLGRLSESEKSLKFGILPEEEAAVQECQGQLQELLKSLQCQELELECITSLGEEILATCHPDSIVAIKSWVTVAKSRFQEVLSWAQQQGERLQAQAAVLAAQREEVARLAEWMASAEEALSLRDQEPLPEEAEALEELSAQHMVFMEELNRKQPEVEKVTKSSKQKMGPDLGPPATRRLPSRRRSSGKAAGTLAVPLGGMEPQSPLVAQLLQRWQQLWLLALDRQYRLETAQQRLRELEEFAHFDFGAWRQRYVQWIGRRKARALDIFRGIDREQAGRVSQRQFIASVLASKFPTNVLEMTAVAAIFDTNGDGFIDYCEFLSALHPSRDPLRRGADADQIQDEVNRQVAQCNCAKRFQVEQISANRYRFGESQQLRMVRILRSTLMVRVGGGWIALDEFLVKNDPCRVKGRTNLKINERYLSSDSFGVTKGAGTPASASPKALSPSRSSSSLSLYSSASAPSSPLARKSVLRRTRSGDRCPRSRGSQMPDGAELPSLAPQETPALAPSESPQQPPLALAEPPEEALPERRSPCR
ncbi:plectin [Dryobates pubescens]|uniref:plectin n=1 Tax=Dryobates pubescens TaxID=118200 RepID=UPI0023B99DA0|nr:plectin [Dryobates pubescens]